MLATATNKRLIQSRLRPIVTDLLAARVVAEDVRPKVDALYSSILSAEEFRTDEGDRITEPKYSYRIAESQFDRYSRLCDDAIRSAGYDVKPGYCPALIAEAQVTKAENAIIKVAAELIDPAFANIWDMKKRDEAIELLCGLALAK